MADAIDIADLSGSVNLAFRCFLPVQESYADGFGGAILFRYQRREHAAIQSTRQSNYRHNVPNFSALFLPGEELFDVLGHTLQILPDQAVEGLVQVERQGKPFGTGISQTIQKDFVIVH